MATTPLDAAASKYSIACLKETQGDVEGARRLFLECEQIYAKVSGADDEETLGEEGDGDQGEEEGQPGDRGER